jgi:hypothetical protein
LWRCDDVINCCCTSIPKNYSNENF